MKKFLVSIIFLGILASSSLAWDVGTGTETDPFVIASASDFSYFRYRVNSGLDAEGSYYRLSNDVQITRQIRTAPVGMSDAPFTGHFDGQGHTIYVKIMPLDEDDEALLSYDRAPFGTIETSSGYAVKNLHVGGSASGYLAAGIVSNLVSGRIESCTFSGDIEAEPVLDDEETEIHLIHAGGIAANMSGGEIVSCDFSGNVTTNGNEFFSYAGGIVGAMSGGKIKGCTVKHYSVITANGEADSGRSKSAGGIVGYLEVDDLSTNSDDATVSNCEFEGGEVNSEYTAGGITGTSYGGILKNNIVGEDTKISGNTLAGGIAGLLSAGGLLQSNDVQGGLVSSDARAAGGVVGLLELGYVEDNNSRAAVRGSSYLGGVVGEVHNHYGSSANIKNNTYSGAAYGIGIDENYMKNQDTGCTKKTDNSFYFITQSVLDNAFEMIRYNAEIEISVPINLDISVIPSWLHPVQSGTKIYLSCTPSFTGKVSFTLTAHYGEQNVSKTYHVAVIPQMSISVNDVSARTGEFINITPSVSSLTDGYLNNATLSWSIVSGDLPSGLEIDETTGAISGIVNQSGEYKFTIQVSAENVSASSVIKDITLTVTGASLSVAITTSSLPSAVVNTQYSQTLSYDVTPGYSVYWSKISGDLPNGFTLSSDGTISGITQTAGEYPFIVSLTAAGITVSKDLTLTVLTSSEPVNPDDPVLPPVKITSTSLSNGTLGQNYRATLSSSPSGASWSQSGGIIPPGLVLSSDGVLSGVPTVTGSFSFYVTASHSQYSSSTQEFEVQIADSNSANSSGGGGGGGCNSFSPLMLVALLLCYNVRKFSAKR